MKINTFLQFTWVPLIIPALVFMFVSCKKDEPGMAVKTISADSHSLIVVGEVVEAGDQSPEYGFCISQSAGHTADSLINTGTTSVPVTFQKRLTGLQPGIVYYVAAYLKTSDNIVYGDQLRLEVLSPVVTFAYDDGASDDAWRLNPGTSGWIGNLFPVSGEGTILEVELYFSKDSAAGDDKLRVDFFNAGLLHFGNTDWFTPPSNDWIKVPCPNLKFSGNFYAMAFWDYTLAGTNYLGIDETGPNVAMDLAFFHDSTGWARMSSLPPDLAKSIFMIRVTADLSGEKQTRTRMVLEPGSPPVQLTNPRKLVKQN
jgi:hypothetical protein